MIEENQVDFTGEGEGLGDRQIRSGSMTADLIFIAVFSALTAIGGWIKIPVPPVPFTMQTLFVYMAGDMLDWRRAAASQVLFIIIGLMGAPVFAGGGGPGYVLKPTFGYLLGFILGAACIGSLAGRRRRIESWTQLLIPNGIGMLLILLPGVLYLAFSKRFVLGRPLTFSQTIVSGLLIFLPHEIGKAAIAAWLAFGLRKRLSYD